MVFKQLFSSALLGYVFCVCWVRIVWKNSVPSQSVLMSLKGFCSIALNLLFRFFKILAFFMQLTLCLLELSDLADIILKSTPGRVIIFLYIGILYILMLAEISWSQKVGFKSDKVGISKCKRSMWCCRSLGLLIFSLTLGQSVGYIWKYLAYREDTY